MKNIFADTYASRYQLPQGQVSIYWQRGEVWIDNVIEGIEGTGW